MPGLSFAPPRFGTRRARVPSSAGLNPRPAVAPGKTRPELNVLDCANGLLGMPPRGQRWRCAMDRHLMMLRVTVKDGERALLTRNGRLEQVLAPGRHRLVDPLHELAVELHNVVRAEFPADRYAALKASRADLVNETFEAVETRGGEVAIVSIDGRPTHVVGPWQVRVYWKVATRVEVERARSESVV